MRKKNLCMLAVTILSATFPSAVTFADHIKLENEGTSLIQSVQRGNSSHAAHSVYEATTVEELHQMFRGAVNCELSGYYPAGQRTLSSLFNNDAAYRAWMENIYIDQRDGVQSYNSTSPTIESLGTSYGDSVYKVSYAWTKYYKNGSSTTGTTTRIYTVRRDSNGFISLTSVE